MRRPHSHPRAGRVSRAEVELHQCMIWTIRSGKIVRVESLEATREEALKASGVPEWAT